MKELFKTIRGIERGGGNWVKELSRNSYRHAGNIIRHIFSHFDQFDEIHIIPQSHI